MECGAAPFDIFAASALAAKHDILDYSSRQSFSLSGASVQCHSKRDGRRGTQLYVPRQRNISIKIMTTRWKFVGSFHS